MESDLEKLSDEELLSTFIQESTANQLIAEYQTIYGVVMHTSAVDAKNTKGLGQSKLHKLACIKELLSRVQKGQSKQITKISSPQDIADYFSDMEDLQQEEFRILMLNTKNHIICQRLISKGTINASLASPREIFSPAIKLMASHIILVHNHPSSEPFPSEEDKRMTEVVVKSGDIINIKVLDHVIIGKNTYFSFKEQDLLSSN